MWELASSFQLLRDCVLVTIKRGNDSNDAEYLQSSVDIQIQTITDRRMRVKLAVGEERAKRSVYRCIYGRYCGEWVMEPCQIYLYWYQHIDIYDNTTMYFVFPNFWLRLRWAPSLSNQLFACCSDGFFAVQISGRLLVVLRSDFFIGYWSAVKVLNINSNCGRTQ